MEIKTVTVNGVATIESGRWRAQVAPNAGGADGFTTSFYYFTDFGRWMREAYMTETTYRNIALDLAVTRATDFIRKQAEYSVRWEQGKKTW